MVGGRLSFFLPAWEASSRDAFVLSVVRGGFFIDLCVPLPGGAIRSRPPSMSAPARLHAAAEIKALLEKGAIERVKDHPRLCLSPIFVIPKRSGKLRMILNMKRINKHIPPVHFRMETLASILPLIREGDYAISLDLKDAYFHVPIHPASRDLLGFAFQNETYRFRVLPFGLRPAPRVFTRVVAVLAASLRSRGLRLFCYLDDWLLLAESETLLLDQVQILVESTQNLGFLINWDKSELSPSRTPLFLGARLDIPGRLARPSQDRIRSVSAAARQLLSATRVSARQWLQFLGYLASMVDLVIDCRLLMRPFQIHMLRHFQPCRDPLTSWIPVPSSIKAFLPRWTDVGFLSRGKPFRAPLPSVTVTTDASLLGWGGHCLGGTVAGDWSHLVSLPHINVLELMAVFLTLHHFGRSLRRRTVLILTDNVTTAAYINRQGGTRSVTLNDLAAQLWRWCRLRSITPVASFIPGQENLIADFLSRGRCLPSEWKLRPEVFVLLLEVYPLVVDLFASAINHQLPSYCSRVRDPEAWAVDAFSIHWGKFQGYAFPPFPLIPRVLAKIREDQARVLLIAPCWPRRLWFPELLSLLAAQPVLLPLTADVVAQPLSGFLHHNPEALHLTAWPLSGRRQDRQVCLRGPQVL